MTEESKRPDVRLAYHPEGDRTLKELGPVERLALTDDGMPSKVSRYPGALAGPTVRLALGLHPNRQTQEALMADQDAKQVAPTIRLAHTHGAQGDNTLLGVRWVDQIPENSSPALLVSFVYLEPFLKNRHRYHYRDWVMDSGAFSAQQLGIKINLGVYIDCCKRLLSEDPTLTEVFALDVIGDWRASLRNAERMWKEGVPAIPCFHHGEPWDVLRGLAKDYPKVAIGGCVGKRDKDTFAGQCFARVWPKCLHGFGFGSEKSIMMYPWSSVDATNWEIGPCKFGRWNAFGGKMSVRGSSQDLRAEVEWYLDLERRARFRWRKEMAMLGNHGQALRLAISDVQTSGNCVEQVAKAFKQPAVRLAVGLPTDRHPNSLTDPTVRLAVQPGSPRYGQMSKTNKETKDE